MKQVIYPFMITFTVVFMSSCGAKMTFKEQIAQDIYAKIADGFCENDNIPKGAEIKNLQIGDITPIGDTGMIDVALEFDVVATDGTEQHMEKAMLYLEKGSGKMLAIFCDYDYREN